MSDKGSKTFFGRGTALLTVMLLAVAAPAAAQESDGCVATFEDANFEFSTDAGPVKVLGADMTQPLFDRFVADIAASATPIGAEIGGLTNVEVCLFGEGVPLDPNGLVPRGQQLHAVAFHDRGMLVLSTRQYAEVRPAAAFGLASIALWQVSEEPHPEPLATTIGQWYSARVLDRGEVNHNAMLFSNLLSHASDWPLVVTEQMPVRAWNPEFQDSAASDLIDFAVDEHGPEVLTETSSEEWSSIGRRWSAALSAELRPNGLGTAWIWGGVIFFGSILLAALLAYIQWRNKRVRKRPEEWTEVLPRPVETGYETPVGSSSDF